VTDIIGANEAYKEGVNRIESFIFEQIQTAHRTASEQYMRFHHIYEFGLLWDEEEFAEQTHTIESVCKQIARMDEFKAELSHFRAHRAVGVMYVHGAHLRGILEPVPEQVLLALRQRLSSLVREKCAAVSQMLDVMIKGLDDRPNASDSERIATYTRLVDTTESQLPKLADAIDEVDAARHVMEKQSIRLSMEDQLCHEIMHTRHTDLEEVKLPQAKSFVPLLFPDLVVSVHVKTGEYHDWSVTCVSMSGSELTQLNVGDLDKITSKDLKATLADRLGVPSSRLVLLQADGSEFSNPLAKADAQRSSKRPSNVSVQAVITDTAPRTVLLSGTGSLRREGDDGECNRF
jgi:hypothetical protein